VCFSARQCSERIGNCAAGIVYSRAKEGWLARPETQIEQARTQRWKNGEKVNCF
jgi:hypothetical protein